MSAPADNLVEITDLKFNYGEREVLKGLSLNIPRGKVVAILGASGCGKSTLLRLAAGLLQPSTGQVRLAGQPAAELRRRQEIGWMAQQSALLPWRTVLDNVRLSRQLKRNSASPAQSPEELLARVGLAQFAGAYPATLSGGMQQRVALARTLAVDASLWLMDEPFAALDELTREALAGELLAIWQTVRPTVLWVTHHLSEAVRLADRVVVLSARPGAVAGCVPVALPRPRDDTGPAFQAVVRQVRLLLAGGGQ